MKKVGIVSCYFKNNYGSMLQAYATQKVLDNMNLENETFNISKNIDFKNGKKKYYKSQLFNYSFIKSKFGMIWLKIYRKINKKLNSNIKMREKTYEEFRKEFNLTKPYYTYKELKEASSKYSTILVGSDQLWLPVNVVADYYTLNWVEENINKVSYSTSFGVSQIPDKYKSLYKKFLERINYISVRENSGCKLVNDLVGRKATLVCDPTMLLNKDEWLEIQEIKPIISEKYILCYFLGKNIEHRKFAERLRKKTGYKIVSLNHGDEYVKYSDKFADIIPYDIGPKEFLNLIRNAEYVCTDSFHGTVFSLINNVKFFTFERYNSKNSKVSTNSRIYSLLDLMGLKNRILKGTEKIDDVINYEMNFEEINNKLESFRDKSKKFLKEALKTSIDEQEKLCLKTKNRNLAEKEDKIKILYFIDRMAHGGIQSLVIEIAKNIDKERFKLDFLLLDDGHDYELENTLKKLDCNVYKLKNVWIRSPFDYIIYYKEMKKFFEKTGKNYNIVHLHSSSKNFLFLYFAKKNNIKIRIAHSHNTGFKTTNILEKLVGNILKKLQFINMMEI